MQKAIVAYLANELKEMRVARMLVKAELDNSIFDLVSDSLSAIDAVKADEDHSSAIQEKLEHRIENLENTLNSIDSAEATLVFEVVTGKRVVL